MIRGLLSLLLLCLVPAGAAGAAPGDAPLAPPAPSDEKGEVTDAARAGDLYILQLWTGDPDAFLAAWQQPTPPRLVTSKRTTRNKAIQQFIILGGCRADAAGHCRLDAHVTITDPDGEPYGEAMRFALWDDQPAPPPGRLVLSPNSIGLIIEDGEKLGTYRVRLAVTDAHAGVTAVSVTDIEVAEAGAPEN